MKCRSAIHSIAGAAVLLLLASPLAAQSPQAPEPPQQKIAQMKLETEKNKELLRGYQWIESTTITIDGNQRPPRQSLCRYGTDGTVQKTPMGGEDMQARGGGGMPGRGRLIQKLIADRKKKAIEKEVAEMRTTAKMYIPFDRAKLKEALQAGNVTFDRDGANGTTIIVKSYAKKGDELTLSLSPLTKEVDHILLKTYLDNPKDKMTGDVEFSTLPNGARYAGLTSIEAPSKNISITITNSNYSKIAD